MGNNMTQLTNKINFDKATGSISIPGLNNKIKILNPFSLVGVVHETAKLSLNTLLDFVKDNFGLTTATNPVPFTCSFCDGNGIVNLSPAASVEVNVPGISVDAGLANNTLGGLIKNNWFLAR